jgi:hypothetical protein
VVQTNSGNTSIIEKHGPKLRYQYLFTFVQEASSVEEAKTMKTGCLVVPGEEGK